MSDINRDKLYSSGSDDWDDDGTEYEVEPLDPEVLAAEERRAAEMIAATQFAVELHEINDEAEGHADREYFENLVRGFRFRFTTKHLLMTTTVVAVVIAIALQADSGTVFLFGMLLTVGGITAYMSWKQHQREESLDRRRQELFAKRRIAQQAALGKKSVTAPPEILPEDAEEPDVDEPDTAPAEQEKFRLQFSLAEMMTVAVCIAVLSGLIAVLGLPATVTLIGFVTLGGLILHASGFEPPYAVACGWWVLLLLYVLLSIFSAIWNSFQS